jgi:hypothetical protein
MLEDASTRQKEGGLPYTNIYDSIEAMRMKARHGGFRTDLTAKPKGLGSIAFATGGLVPKYFAKGGYSVGTDTVPAMLTPGEYVLRKDAVKKYGVDNLDKLNAQKFAKGGEVGKGKKDNWFQNYVKKLTKSSDDLPALARDPLGVQALLRKIAGQGREGDALSAALMPLNYMGFGLGGKLALGAKGASVAAKGTSVAAKVPQIGNKKTLSAFEKELLDQYVFLNDGQVDKAVGFSEMVSKYRLPEHIKEVYRGTQTDMSSLKIGDTYNRTRKMSTSLSDSEAHLFARTGSIPGTLLKILVDPKIARGIEVNKVLGKDHLYADELEVLLSSGKFKVIAKDTIDHLGVPGEKLPQITLQQIKGNPIDSVKDKALDVKKLLGKRKSIPNGVLDGMNFDGTALATGGLVSKYNIPRFKTGVNRVPQDMLAMIHKNEAVLPAKINPYNPNATNIADSGGTVYNINMPITSNNANPSGVADEVMRRLRVELNKNNKSNKVMV